MKPMAEPVRLTDWSYGYAGFTTPTVGARLLGAASGHPDNDDGERIFTSYVERAEGRRVWTRSGREYELVGPPTQAYLDFLAEHGWTYNDAAPFESAPPAPPKTLIRRVWEAFRRG
jgi:hypothetical protein